MVRRVEITKLLLACSLALLALPAQAQDGPERMMLDAGIVGGNSVACPGHYVGVAGPVSVYGMVETYRCVEAPETSSRLGTSVRLGPFRVVGAPGGAYGVGVQRRR